MELKSDLKTTTITAKELIQWIIEFKGEDFYSRNSSGFDVVNGLTYTGLDYIGENQPAIRFFIVYNNTDIIAVVKYANKMYNRAPLTGDKKVGTINYLEINEEYQGKGYLKKICELFAKAYPNDAFCSNSESKRGKDCLVNDHIKKALENEHIQFFESESKFNLLNLDK